MSIMTKFFATAKGLLTNAKPLKIANDAKQTKMVEFRVDTITAGGQITAIGVTHRETNCTACKAFKHGEIVNSRFGLTA